MAQKLAELLKETIDGEIEAIRAVATLEPARPGAWAKKQELGHLIDSAANNHVRFVRGALDPEYRGPGYDAEAWVALHGYADLPWTMLVDFWERYNRLLVELVARIPEERLSTVCIIGEGQPVTLGFVIQDYVRHLKHHLDHLLGRK